MFQVVGASPGLLDTDSREYQVAVRLCRYGYPAHSAERPRAFGWIDAVDKRFAFSRDFLPNMQTGRSGNFAAHVLVGTRAELPVELILSGRDSPLWWREPRDHSPQDLPRIDAREVRLNAQLPIPEVSLEDAAEILAGILAQSIEPLGWDNPDRFLSVVHYLTSRMPSLIELISVSSFENGEPSAGWFDVVGTTLTTPARRTQTSSSVTSAVQYALDSSIPSRQINRLLGELTDLGRAAERYVQLASSLARARTVSSTGADILFGLRAPDAIEGLLDHARARELVVQGIVENRDEVVRALTRNRAHVSAPAWELLGCETANLVEGVLSPASRAAVESLPDRFIAGFLRASPRSRATYRTWGPRIVQAALRSGPLDAELVDQFADIGLAEWLADESLHLNDRVRLLERLTSRRPQALTVTTMRRSPRLLAATLRDSPDALVPIINATETGLAAELIELGLSTISANAPPRATNAHLQLIGRVALSMAVEYPPDGLKLITMAQRAFPEPGGAWKTLMTDVSWSYLAQAMANPALPLAALNNSPDSSLKQLRRLSTARTLPIADLYSAVRNFVPVDLTSVARKYVIEHRIRLGDAIDGGLRGAANLAHADSVSPTGGWRVLLIAANRATYQPDYVPLLAIRILALLGDAVERGQLDQGRQEPRDGLDRLAKDCFHRLQAIEPEHTVELIDRYRTSRGARAWMRMLRSP